MENTLSINSKKIKFIEVILFAIGLFLVPLLVPQILNLIFGESSVIANNSQLIVGSIVNLSLILVALKIIDFKEVLLFATLPSISAISSGFVFGTFTKFAIFMMPAVWIGNLALILVIKYVFVNKKLNYFVSAILGIIVKVGIMYGILNILLICSLIPIGGVVEITLKTSMGIMQLITASIGTVLAFAINRIFVRLK